MSTMRDILARWERCWPEYARFYVPAVVVGLREVLDKDDQAHAAELAERDKRIAELEEAVNLAEGTMRSAAHNAQRRLEQVKERDQRISELEGAKRELPPLPESVRAHLRNCRVAGPTLQWTRDLIAWEDANFPKPVPQWELDAQAVSEMARGKNLTYQDADAIAARIREAHRGNSK